MKSQKNGKNLHKKKDMYIFAAKSKKGFIHSKPLNTTKMKRTRLFICAAMLLCGLSAAHAEEFIFDRFAVGVEVGTAGAGLELATPVTRFVTLRAGVSALPQLGRQTTIPYSIRNIQYSTTVEAKLHMMDAKLLADIYPFPESSFHLTTGLYVGSPNFIVAQNTAALQGVSNSEGVMVGGMLITPDNNGIVKAAVRTAGLKPYAGIGFGRPVSDHHLNFAMDLGVQYWGKPTLNAWSPTEETWAAFTSNDVKNEEFNKALDILSGIPVWPVLNFRLYYCF